MQGHCGERLTCQVIGIEACVMWSGMRRSKTTYNPHLTVEKESKASIELLSLGSTDEMTARSKCKCQCFGFQDLPEDVGKW